MIRRIGITALRIALLYALFGAVWIAVIDNVLTRIVADFEWMRLFQAYSAWIFIAATAWILYLLVGRELRARQRAEEVLRGSEERFRALVQHSADVVFILTPDGVQRYASPNVEIVLGHSADRGTQLNILELVHPEDRDAVRQAMQELRGEVRRTLTVEFRGKHADGSYRSLEAWGKNLLDDVSVSGIVLNVRDITERKEFEAEIQRLAYYDALTGLANRRLLRERARQTLALARRNGNAAALLYLDLDRFKAVNDTLGHDAGDELLKHVAARLGKCVREVDTLARLGGDEFAVLLTNVREEDDPALVARRVVHALEESIWVQQHPVHIGTSIGIALYPQDGSTYEEVMKHADIAMYRAKAEKSGFQFYRPDLSVYTRDRLLLEEELRQAVEMEQLQLHYQPILELNTREVAGMEALSRWPHSHRGKVPPAEFIALAEETGLIVQLDHWAVVSAVRMLRSYIEQGWNGWISVNISARSLADPDLVPFIANALGEQGVDPRRLVLEVTESTAMRNPEATAELLYELKRAGVLVAVDDFGLGYSSLAYLKRFPVDILKIDRSFVRGIGTDSKDERLIEAVITLSHGLGVQVLAEGVEHQRQLNYLVAEGCDLVQGFLIGDAMAAADLQHGLAGAAGTALGLEAIEAMQQRPFPED